MSAMEPQSPPDAKAARAVTVRRADFKDKFLPLVCAWTGEPAEKWQRVGPWRCCGWLPISETEHGVQKRRVGRVRRWQLLDVFVLTIAFNFAINWSDPRAPEFTSALSIVGSATFWLLWGAEWQAQRLIRIRPHDGDVTLEHVHPNFAVAVADATEQMDERTEAVRAWRVDHEPSA